MSGFSLSHLFKHLTCTTGLQIPRRTTHRLLHRFLSSFSPQNLPQHSSSCSKLKLILQWRRFSSTPAATGSLSSKDSSLPPYLSVLIKCRKDVAVCCFLLITLPYTYFYFLLKIQFLFMFSCSFRNVGCSFPE